MKTLSEFLLKEQSERTRNQYASSWSQFLRYLQCMDISPDQVKEATVVNFLEYRMSVDGVLPNTVRQNFYGLIGPLRAAFNLKVSAKDPCSLIRIFLSGALRSDKGNQRDMFPTWHCKDLIDYLKLNLFEPLETNVNFERVRAKAVVLLMLATGRRLEDVSALISDWERIVISEDSYMIKFRFYDGWTGKAERPLDNWVSPRITLFAIDPVEGQDREVLCPLHAFNRFWSLRQKGIIPAKLINILRLCNFSSLSYSVNNLLPWSSHVPKAN